MFSYLSTCLTLGAFDFVSHSAGFSVFLDWAGLVSWPVGSARRVCLGAEAGGRDQVWAGVWVLVREGETDREAG